VKKFYALMIAFFAVVIGTTGCGSESAPIYGVPHDDNTIYDEDFELDEDADVDIAPMLNDAEYGVISTDYDVNRDPDEI